jgi:phage/plasmid-associated DNA primase
MTTNAELDAQVVAIDAMRAPAFSDEALAQRFASECARNLRYVAAWSKWLLWDGKRWVYDDTLRYRAFSAVIIERRLLKHSPRRRLSVIRLI